MKVYRLILALLLLCSGVIFNSCKKDDPSIPDILIVADRANGKIYQVNLSTGALTELAQVMLSSSGLGEIRGMVYNPSNQTLYATSTNDGSGKLYSINPTTAVANQINGDPSDYWYGLPDIKLTSDNKLLATVWHKAAGPTGDYGPGLIKFNLDGSVAQALLFNTTDPAGIDMCCGFGLTFGDSQTELLIASSENDFPDIYSSTLSGSVTYEATLTLQGFTVSDQYMTIKNLVKFSGKTYALVFGYDDELTYLAELDLVNNKLIQIAKLSATNSVQYNGLAVIAGNLF